MHATADEWRVTASAQWFLLLVASVYKLFIERRPHVQALPSGLYFYGAHSGGHERAGVKMRPEICDTQQRRPQPERTREDGSNQLRLTRYQTLYRC